MPKKKDIILATLAIITLVVFTQWLNTDVPM
jgi:hypothetical protein